MSALHFLFVRTSNTLVRKAANFFWRCTGALFLATRTLATAPPTRRTAADGWAASCVTALPEIWALVAEHSGFVGAWRLTGVCRASREGVLVWLRTLPGLVVCGGFSGVGQTSEVWRLDLGILQWQHTSNLTHIRASHACCTVRGSIVVLGGDPGDDMPDESVEMLLRGVAEAEEDMFEVLPSLSCGPVLGSSALVIDEIESEKGRVLLIGGDGDEVSSAAVHTVDLATGRCTPQPHLTRGRFGCAAARLPDGRVVCAGGKSSARDLQGFEPSWITAISAEILDLPEQESPSAGGQWRPLPRMSVERFGGTSCVLSDGRFAVFGGRNEADIPTASCEALTLDGGERWQQLPPMYERRSGFACAAVGGCVIVAGGDSTITVEVYEEALGRWRRFPRNLPHDTELSFMGCALL